MRADPAARDDRPVRARVTQSRTRCVVTAASAVVLVLAAARFAAAQELEPRAYTNLPIGLNFLIAGYSYNRGDVTTETAFPLQDGEFDFHGMVLGYVRSMAIAGRSAKIDVVLPYSVVSGSATFLGQPFERNIDGFGDPRVRLSMNLYGAPALSLAQFAEYESDLVIGASLQVGVPLGQYDPEKLLNIGTNRWLVKPKIGFAKTWGRLTVEMSGALSIFTANDDYLSGQTLRQEPVYSLQSHALYSFPFGIWTSVDFTYYGGGSTKVDGVPGIGAIESTRVGATLALPVSRYQSLKLYGSTGATARTGSDFDTVGVAWQVRWGAGL